MTTNKELTIFLDQLSTIPDEAEQKAKEYYERHHVKPQQVTQAATSYVADIEALKSTITDASEQYFVSVAKKAAILKRERIEAESEEQDGDGKEQQEDADAKALLGRLRLECTTPPTTDEAPLALTPYEAETRQATNVLDERTSGKALVQNELIRGWLMDVKVRIGRETEVESRLTGSKAKRPRNSQAVFRPKRLFKLMSRHRMYRLRHWNPQLVTMAEVIGSTKAIRRVLAADKAEQEWWAADPPRYSSNGPEEWISFNWLLNQ